MKRDALLLIVLAAIVVFPHEADAQAAEVLIVSFQLRANLHDEILVCQDTDFSSESQALSVADRLQPLFGIEGMSSSYDPTYQQDCFTYSLSHPLTKAVPGRHERLFTFDARPLIAGVSKVGYQGLSFETCVPQLRVKLIEPKAGSSNYTACDDQGFAFDVSSTNLNRIAISFAATPRTLLFGVLTIDLFWTIIILILAFLVWLLNRWKWRFFITLRFIAWPLDIILLVALSFLWGAFAAYESPWIPSLQLYLHIGDAGAVAIIGLPIIGMLVAFTAGVRHEIRRFASLSTQSAPAARVDVPRLTAPRAQVVVFLQLLPFVAAMLISTRLLGSRAVGPGSEYAAIGFSLLLLGIEPLWSSARVSLAGGLDRSTQTIRVASALKSVGINPAHIYVSSRPPGRGSIPEMMSPVSLTGSSVIIWEKIATMDPSVLAGAAIETLGVSTLVLGAIYLAFTVLISEPRADVTVLAPSLVGLVLLLVAIRIILGVRRRRRTLDAAARSVQASDFLKGILLGRWIAARLVARRSARAFPASMRPSGQSWRRGLRVADRFAARANIPPERVQAIVQEVMATDLG